MNRRAFITGLLSTTAALALPTEIPVRITVTIRCLPPFRATEIDRAVADVINHYLTDCMEWMPLGGLDLKAAADIWAEHARNGGTLPRESSIARYEP